MKRRRSTQRPVVDVAALELDEQEEPTICPSCGASLPDDRHLVTKRSPELRRRLREANDAG